MDNQGPAVPIDLGDEVAVRNYLNQLQASIQTSNVNTTETIYRILGDAYGLPKTGTKSIAADIKAAVAKQIELTNQQIDSVFQNINDSFDRYKSLSLRETKKLEQKAGANKASITETKQVLATLDGEVAAMYTLDVDANGVVAGMKLGSDGQNSVIKFYADHFAVANAAGDPKNVFAITTIEGEEVIIMDADIFIRGDAIMDGTLSLSDLVVANTITGMTIQGNTFIYVTQAGLPFYSVIKRTYPIPGSGTVTVVTDIIGPSDDGDATKRLGDAFEYSVVAPGRSVVRDNEGNLCYLGNLNTKTTSGPLEVRLYDVPENSSFTITIINHEMTGA